jgi:Cytochrome oxidase complex assembly protein 1
MTTKKIVIIIAAVVLVIGALVVLFVGGIVGFALYSLGNSEAAVTAKDFLRNNDRLKQDIGEIKDFGSIVTGNINIDNNNGAANLNLKVIGEKKTVNASVQLMYRNGNEWRVTEASYKNDEGQTVDLLNAFELYQPYNRYFHPAVLFQNVGPYGIKVVV